MPENTLFKRYFEFSFMKFSLWKASVTLTRKYVAIFLVFSNQSISDLKFLNIPFSFSFFFYCRQYKDPKKSLSFHLKK